MHFVLRYVNKILIIFKSCGQIELNLWVTIGSGYNGLNTKILFLYIMRTISLYFKCLNC